MVSRLLAIIRKEFTHIFRDPQTLGIVLIMPISMLLLMGYAVAADIEHIPTAVFDQAMDSQSRVFLEKFWQTGFFERERTVHSQQEIQDLIDEGLVRVGIIIPPGFAADLEAGKEVQVQVLIDGSDTTIAQVAQFAAESIGQASAVEIVGVKLGKSGLGTPSLVMPILMRPRLLYNPNLDKVNALIPSLIGMILQFQSIFLTSFAIVREREQGTLEQLIVTPVKPWELMVGKVVPFVLLAFLNVGLTLAVGYFVFGVEFSGSLTLLLTLSIVFLLGSLGTGVLISTVSRTQMQANHLASFVLLPAIILSGFFIPRDNMPALAYYAGYLIPLTYFNEILRGIVMKGVGMAFLWKHVVPLSIFGIAVFVLSVLRFQKRLE
jgi:ABC-2 type transport system permease protein